MSAHRSGLLATPITRREFLLILFLTLFFTLILQFDFSRIAPDGTRSIMGHSPWSIGSPAKDPWADNRDRVYRKGEQLTLDEDDEEDQYEKLTGADAFVGRLAGVNELGSHGNVGRWREMTMNDTLVRWGEEGAPRTEVIAHAPGWTIFRNLYLYNGTWFIVTDDPSDFPLLRLMVSTGAEIWNDEESIKNREPTDKDMKIIFPSEAKTTLGHHASKVEGTTWLCNDPAQFLDHYYHFAAEIIFGMWRTYSTLDRDIPPEGITRLPSPRRMLFTHSDPVKWRDYSKMNAFLLKSMFPSMSYEFSGEMQDRTDSGRPFLYDRVVFQDRAAALRGPQFAKTWRNAAEAYTLEGSPYWWSPIRRNLLEFVGGMSEAVLHPLDMETPVITYVSRQDWGRRMLKKADHEKLVEELHRIQKEHGYEVNIVSMDKLTRDEQIRLAARTTIMLGVHGNGLTHLLWMKPTPRATVIEFFYPKGFAHDYEFTSRALGITHYGFWGNEYFTAPETPDVSYPEGFQGNEIPIDGKVVADLIVARLSIEVEQEAEDSAEMMEGEGGDAEDEEVVLTDETDPEVMDAEEEGVN